MPGEATWQWSQVLGVSINSSPCWESVYEAGTNDFTHTCSKPGQTLDCIATVRFLNGQKVKYTGHCEGNPANAFQILRDGADLIVHRFDSEDWS